jgi:type II restriction/modification system DNA methylase subunit YeeA
VCLVFVSQAWGSAQRNTVQCVGLVSTNIIRGGANRAVLDSIVLTGRIFEAWSDETWTVEGSAVRVSLICFERTGNQGPRLDGAAVSEVYANLTSGHVDVTTARPIRENKGIAFNGIQKTGEFELPGTEAREMLLGPRNADGRHNSEVVRPWWNGLNVTGRNRDMWIIDFGLETDGERVAYFVIPYSRLARLVKPTRIGKREARTNDCWWLFQWPRPFMRAAVHDLYRCIVTPETPTHTVFAWLPSGVVPDKNLIVIARDDDTTFGILHSKIHLLWTRALGSPYGNHPTARRYNLSRTFETFPFPEQLTPNISSGNYADNPHAKDIATAARELVEKRDLWLNPPDLIERVPEVVPGYPDRIIPRNPKAAAI